MRDQAAPHEVVEQLGSIWGESVGTVTILAHPRPQERTGSVGTPTVGGCERTQGGRIVVQVIAGRYTLEAEIGRGGMGAVWRGRDEVLGRTVALKKIGVAPGGITPDARRAEREAKLAAKLNHANVVAVFDLVEEDIDGHSQQWLVMEYVEGTDLANLIRERRPAQPDEVGADPGPGGQRAGRRARRRDRAPRREALQHPGRARRPGEAVRLRHRAHRRPTRR